MSAVAAELAVVVVSFNALEFLPRCLGSVVAHLAGIPHEVCVVDNASTDGSGAIIAREYPRARLITNQKNLGFAAAMNAGLAATRAPMVLWLNPDAEIVGGRVADVLTYLREHAEVGILAPQLVDEGGSIQLSCRAFPRYRTVLGHRYALLTRWFPANPLSREYLYTDWDHGSVREVDWVSGACLLHRRAALDEVGGLDSRFFMYCEDVDFCLRARQAGWRVAYHPGLKVLHRIGGSTRRQPVRMVLERHRSMWHYYAKHFRRNPVTDAAVGAGLLARCAWLMARAAWPGVRAEMNSPLGMLWAKRPFDVLLSGLGLLFSTPLWLVISIAIKVEGGGPVLYNQERVGRGGRRFVSWKFRSMLPDSDARFGPLQATRHDARVTRQGRFLRSTALDELPQLWNIFKGDMSFVGPRALMPEEIETKGDSRPVPLEKIPGYEARHAVRPGLTGLAQVYGPRNLPRRQKFRYDLLYIRKRSFCLDLKLIALSFWISFRGRWEEAGTKL